MIRLISTFGWWPLYIWFCSSCEYMFVMLSVILRIRARSFACHPMCATMNFVFLCLMKSRNTKFIVAHMGWHANDLARLGRMMDNMPNIYPEVAAVLYDIGRQPRAAHDFFIKYQDRLLFGKDSFEPDKYPHYWRVFETADEYFDYYRDYQASWKLYGANLLPSVLKKLYYANALRITPDLPKTGFTGN